MKNPERAPVSNKRFFVAGLFFLAWFVAINISFDAAYYTQGITQFFVYGRSLFKTAFFLIWSSILCFSLAWEKTPRLKVSAFPMFSCVLLLAVMNLFAHYLVFSNLGIPLNQYGIFVSDLEISDSSLAHTHTLKGTMALLIEWVKAPAVFRFCDAGLPFHRLLSPRFEILAIFFLIAALFFFLAFPVTAYERWPEKLRLPLFAGYLVASCTVVKGTIDGGPLSPEFPVYLALLVAVVFANEKSSIGNFVCTWLIALFVFCAPRLLLPFPLTGDRTYVTNLVMYISFVSFLFSGLSAISRRSPVFLVAAFLFAVPALVASRDFFWLQSHREAGMIYQPGDTVYITDNDCDSPQDSAEYRESGLCVYRMTLSEKQSGYDLRKRFRMLPGYRLMRTSRQSCESQYFNLEGEIYTREKIDPAAMETTSPLFSSFSLEPCSVDRTCRYRYKGSLKSCISPEVHLPVIHRLYSMGLRQFALHPTDRTI